MIPDSYWKCNNQNSTWCHWKCQAQERCNIGYNYYRKTSVLNSFCLYVENSPSVSRKL